MIDQSENPDFLNEFLDYSLNLNKSINSVKEYNYDISHFLKYIKYRFGLVKVKDPKDIKDSIKINDLTLETISKIQIEDIYAFLSYLRKTYNSQPATVARKTSTIKIFFHYLCNEMKKIPENPALDVKSPKLNKRLPKYLTLDESKKLLEATAKPIQTKNPDRDYSVRNYAIITLFLNCGIRLSELVGININDINFNENTIRVIGKGNKERQLFLNESCINAIKAYLEVRPHERC